MADYGDFQEILQLFCNSGFSFYLTQESYVKLKGGQQHEQGFIVHLPTVFILLKPLFNALLSNTKGNCNQ